MTNPVACKIMAGAMHYSMLATFTWFAVKAVHLNLQLFMAGKTTISHYILKVSITSWGELANLPSLLGTEKGLSKVQLWIFFFCRLCQFLKF